MKDINFIETDSYRILSELIDGLSKAIDEDLYPGDERRIYAEQLAQVIVLIHNKINDAARQKLLRYARGEVLDAIGERLDVERLNATPAQAFLKFELSKPLSYTTLIPKGTKATPDGRVFFATFEDVTIPAGHLNEYALAKSTTFGEELNNYGIGEINILVDPIPMMQGVSNIEVTYGGGDVESDDRYRERIREAPHKLSTAGPEGSYAFWAKSADVDIVDVSVTSPQPGEVMLTILMEDGRLPSSQVLEKVLEVCNSRERRPLTDLVHAQAPEAIPFDIDIKYYVTIENEGAAVKAIEDQGGAIDSYISWQTTKMGRDINPDKLRQMLLDSGALRLDVIKPDFKVLINEQIAQFSGLRNVTYEISEE